MNCELLYLTVRTGLLQVATINNIVDIFKVVDEKVLEREEGVKYCSDEVVNGNGEVVSAGAGDSCLSFRNIVGQIVTH